MQYLDQDRRQLYIDINRLMLILFLIIICKGNVQAANVQYSGYCGCASAFKSVRWNYADGVLTISGEGEMADYKCGEDGGRPWFSYADDIQKVVVEEGVTRIGQDAFSELHYLKEVELPESLLYLGQHAFFECWRLTELNLPSRLNWIGPAALAETSIRQLVIPGSVNYIFNSALSNIMGCQKWDDTILDGVLDRDERYSVIMIEEGVGSLGFYAIGQNPYVQTIYFPSTMTNIEYPTTQETVPWKTVNAIYGKNDYVKDYAENGGAVYVDATQTYDIEQAVCTTELVNITNPEPKLTLCYMHGDNEVKLNEGVDYSVTYMTNGEKETAVVTGLGCYTGKKELQIVYKKNSDTGTGEDTKKDDSGSGTGEDAKKDDSDTSGSLGRQDTRLSMENTRIGEIADCIYCGREMQPQVAVYYQGIRLQADRDYRVTYRDNINAGTATVVIAGIGTYSGYMEKTFSILPYDMSGLSDILKGKDGSIYKAAYTGKKICPVTVFRLKTAWQEQMVYLQPQADRDYTCRYQNNKKLGEGRIIYTFRGNYTGTMIKRFLIVPQSPKLRSVKRKARGRYLTWNKSKGCDYYEVYRRQSKKAAYKKIATVKSGSYLDKKTSKKKTYYYRIVVCKAQKKQVLRSAYSNEKKSK